MCIALPLQAIAKIYSVWENRLCLTVWNTSKIWKVKSGFIQKKKKQLKTTKSLQVSFQTHSCETQEHLLKYDWQSSEIYHIQEALFRFA